MPEVMRQLRAEHRNMEKLLAVLEHQLAAFDRAENPDYDVLSTIAEYFTGFPDRCHHPKEDLIYQKLREQDPAIAEAVGNLEAEHAKLAGRAGRFREAVHNVLNEVEVSRDAFDAVARHFVRDQRRHLQTEEARFFPLAIERLTPADWAEIDARAAQEDDPLFGTRTCEAFAALRDDILKWEAEDETMEAAKDR